MKKLFRNTIKMILFSISLLIIGINYSFASQDLLDVESPDNQLIIIGGLTFFIILGGFMVLKNQEITKKTKRKKKSKK